MDVSKSNKEIAILETLGTVSYLLKYTDNKHGASANKIADLLSSQYGYKVDRKRIPDILEILEKHQKETKKLGFAVSKKSFGNNSFERYYISYRLLDIRDINNIQVALYKDDNNLSIRDSEIIDGLIDIFATEKEIKDFKDDNKVNLGKLTGIRRAALKKINEAYNKRLPIKIKLYDNADVDKKDICGYIGKIKPMFDDYIIEIYDKELSQHHEVSLKTIHEVSITDVMSYDGMIYRPEQFTPGTVSFDERGKLNRFMTLDMLDHKNYVREWIEFELDSLEVAKDLLLHFPEAKLNYNLDELETAIRSGEKLRPIRADVNTSRSEFINWACSASVILNIRNIKPYDIEKAIHEYFVFLANITGEKIDIFENIVDEDDAIIGKALQEISLPLDATILRNGHGKAKNYAIDELIRNGIIEDWERTHIVFANLNKDGNTFWASPKLEYGKDMMVFVFNDPRSRRLYIFRFDFNELFDLDTPQRLTKGVPAFDINVQIFPDGIFRHRKLGTDFSRRLPIDILY